MANCSASEVLNTSFLNQSTSFSLTTLYTTTAAGLYRVNIVVDALSSLGGPSFTLGWTDVRGGSSTTPVNVIINNSGPIMPILLSCTSGSAITLQSGSFTPATNYDVYAVIEQL